MTGYFKNFVRVSVTVCAFMIWANASPQGIPSRVNKNFLVQDSVEEQLVKLAWQNNPTGKAAVFRSRVAERAVGQERRGWLDAFKFTGNINEFNLDPEKSVRSMYFPRYNFSLTLTMNDLLGRPAMVRTRKMEAEVSKLEAETQMQTIKSDVLKAYNHYLSVKARLDIQRKLESEIGVNLELARSKFNQGNESYDVLTSLIEKHFNTQLALKELEETVAEAKINLEALIGVRLETVLKN